MSLTFDIVSAKGLDFHEEGLDRVVVRRREERFHPGSEFAICTRHAALLMQTEECVVRLTRGARTETVVCPPGVLEVLDDCVTLAIT
jgi:F0F1-type ATP synthase epsilon subunit